MNVPKWPVGRGAPSIGSDVDAICLVFSRGETEAPRVGRGVDDLMLLTDDDRLRRQLVHGVFFSFDGWEADPREVVSIPECRRYLRQLHASWPYWLHFLAPDPQLWSVLLLCLANPVRVDSDEPGRMKMSVDPGEIREIVAAMLRPMNLLHEEMGLSELQRKQIFERSMGAIQALLA